MYRKRLVHVLKHTGAVLAAGLVLSLVVGRRAAAQDVAHRPALEAERLEAYHARADSLIDYWVHRIDASDRSHGSYTDIAAKLYREQDLDWVLARLDTLMQAPRGDMFWMYPMTLIHFVGRDVLPAAYRRRLRDLWDTYHPYRGDTENHWAMYYTSLYLMSQRYPGLPGSRWYNGKSSVRNHREAAAYLIDWMELTTTKGQGEFDSPWYMNYYVLSMALLYGYADDAAMRRRARMMLDYLLADFAVESLNGLYAGAFSRIYPRELFNRWKATSTVYAWLLFGNVPFRPRLGPLILALSGYEPPAVLYHLATDRTTPYVHRELKRTRHRIRYGTERNAPVYKYMYMSKDYALGSIQGGLLQPIQQHTWELLWATDEPEEDLNEDVMEYRLRDYGATGEPKEGLNMLFTLHPYASSYELAMYFPEEPELIMDAVTRSKSTYDQPDKWTGASPYERVVQVKDALVVLYDIPEGTRFPHISGFFSKRLTRREEDASGWIFARGGDALIAYYPLAPYTWREEEGKGSRLFSPHRKNGAVVQVAPASAYDSFDAFKAAVRALPLEARTEPTPHVRFETLRGDEIDVTYGETPRVDGAPVDYDDWPLFEGPFMEAQPGSERLLLRHGRLRRLLDFERLTITKSIE